MNENIVFVAGAGISVESGIQPFRGKDGIWEENPIEMATYRKFINEPEVFLSWYYNRFKSCLDAKPNDTHKILASNKVKLITQNIDGLHRKANHSTDHLIEIHGCLNEKRIITASTRDQLIPAGWDKVDESDLTNSLFNLFNIYANGHIDEMNSYRPHVLLFDEIYTDLYLIEDALKWVLEADTIIFMGTSNSVGITAGILEMALDRQKKILVVDPNPDISFKHPKIQLYQESASAFCRNYFNA
jgi:NAD-dependent deacetylase